MNGRGRWCAAALVVLSKLAGAEQDPVNFDHARPANPVLVQTAPGRFEIASLDTDAAHAVATEAESAWRVLAAPLGLPDAFNSAVLVRLIPTADWDDPAPFRVIVETGGVVSVRVRWSAATPQIFIRRALVQALLMRLAAARHGVNDKLTAPLWLEQACVGWWRTRANPAALDLLMLESKELAPPALADLLGWQRSDVEPRPLVMGAIWLLSWLQAESGQAQAWPALRARLLSGEEPLSALSACYSGKFADDEERELWWQTGWHHLRRVRTLPQLGVPESRSMLADAARFVFSVGGRDTVLPLRFVLRRKSEPAVAAELARRERELGRLVPALHPFYINAGLSLAAALEARGRTDFKIDELCAAFDRDWRDATELQTATTDALDALERRR